MDTMTASKNAHCLIKVNGCNRRLFTMVERPRLDLMISFQAMDVMGEGYGKEHEGKRIKLQKYSVHPSPDSPTRINAIKHEVVLEDGTVFTGEHYTRAIKQHGRFAYLATVWCPDLNRERYVYRKRALKRLVLGAYDPALMTLQYAIFVGARGLKFAPVENTDFNYSSMDFELFRIVVLWSFAYAPSASAGIKTHGETVKPEDVSADDKERYDRAVKGLDAMEAVTLFRSIRGSVYEHYLRRVVAVFPELQGQAMEFRSWGYSKEALIKESNGGGERA